MNLNELKREVKIFEKKTGFEKTDSKKLLKMIQQEIDILRSNVKNKEVVNHKLMDLQVLILQMANRYNTNLNSEWIRHFKKSEKYLKASMSRK